jgi:hypothetical protein
MTSRGSHTESEPRRGNLGTNAAFNSTSNGTVSVQIDVGRTTTTTTLAARARQASCRPAAQNAAMIVGQMRAVLVPHQPESWLNVCGFSARDW